MYASSGPTLDTPLSTKSCSLKGIIQWSCLSKAIEFNNLSQVETEGYHEMLDLACAPLNARKKDINTKEFRLMRSIADTVFMNGMNASEPPVRSWKKFAAYWAVRMFGWSAIKSSAPRKW